MRTRAFNETFIEPERNYKNTANVTIVLVTHNRPELLKEALKALANQSCCARDVIVVDNASSFETSEVLTSAPLKLDVIRSETNLGGAGGFALGMRRALQNDSEWMWLLDDDAIAETEALALLVARLEGLPEPVGALCSRVMEFGSVALQHRRRFNTTFGFEQQVPEERYFQAFVKIDTASFVGFMVSARAVRKIGLPNENFFLSYDDTEYSLRLRKYGFDIIMIPTSTIFHKRLAASRMRSNEFGVKHYYNIRNRIFVKRLYAHAPQVGAMLGAAFGVLLWARAPKSARSWPILKGAIADGYAGRLGPIPERLRDGTTA